MKLRKSIPLIIAVCILTGVIAVSSKIDVKTSPALFSSVSSGDTATGDSLAYPDTPDDAKEMRGVWLSYMELDMQNEKNKSESAFKNKFQTIVQNCKNFGFNTLIVQVRPFCDALYKSSYFPWSHILTGTQGKDPGYDPLKIMCEICRNSGLKIHAWVNPYRISTNETPQKLSDDNPYVKDSSLGKETNSGIYFDPSNEKAQKLIVDGVKEIAENYDIDGIQFDDYFYPTDDNSFDKTEFNAYVDNVGLENSMSLDNWRKANVNMLVCETYRAVHNAKENVVFGISPQGNIENNENLYADVKSWCSCKGFIDYICPQIYFSLNNPALTFEDSLKSWAELDYDDNVKLYVGLAGYKAGTDDDENTWSEKNNILSSEYQIVKKNDKANGIMLYSYASLFKKEGEKEIDNFKKALQ